MAGKKKHIQLPEEVTATPVTGVKILSKLFGDLLNKDYVEGNLYKLLDPLPEGVRGVIEKALEVNIISRVDVISLLFYSKGSLGDVVREIEVLSLEGTPEARGRLQAVIEKYYNNLNIN